jgi:hypothetical protein
VAEGLISAVADEILDDLLTSYPWVKLHVGAPGAAGTSNPATNTTRLQASFAAASGGSATTDTDLEWTSVPAAEDYTHCSGWSAETDGSCGWTGTITANAVGSGDDFIVEAGDLDVSIPVAS